MKKILSQTMSIALLAASPLALTACGQSNAQEADRFAKVEIKTEQLADGVAVLFGAGGNIGVSYGPDGTVLIDDQFAPLTPKIQAAIAALGAEPVKYLINTHWHGDHSGGNENFGKTGALIMAHDHVRERMMGTQKSGKGNDPASPTEALPVVTYHDGLKLHLNGDEVQVKHMKHAHTDGDSIIFWKKANVIHMGDTFFNKVTLPFIDIESGGNVAGILAAAETVLTMVDDETKIIPGHGPMANKADLIAYRDMLKSVIGTVETARTESKTLAQIQAMKPAARWDTNKDAFIKGDAFVEAVYKSFENPAHKEHDHKH
ncbi:MAG: MBL fold metallo-hydrolase [Parasphingorhabdus sp.]|uniref:MBL fold metallo-hydrolase n=1 Tax=Parasphingorhabdus sp. TaxID=2709688 RepID=UPI0030021836